MSKKLFIKTYGCQMNVYDSELMQEMLSPHGYDLCHDMKQANLVILNTCHIREKAAEKMYSELGRVNKVKQTKKAIGDEFFIAVAGCVGQAEGEYIFKRAPFVDMVVGPQSIHSLPDLLSAVRRDHSRQINLEFTESDKFDSIRSNQKQAAFSAFVSIQEGCDKFCTFCVVPYTRGAEYSRRMEDILTEIQTLVNLGSKEVTLLGQNVNAYHGLNANGDTVDLAQLIRHIAQIDGIERIRYMTSHPVDMTPSLFEAHASEEKLMPFLHLPVQSGSNQILKRMNRKHTREDYFAIMDKLRQLRPDIQLSSDFIVGFPGETDDDFQQTIDLVERVRFSIAYSFKYSPRPGTPASEYEDSVDEAVKDQRLQHLQRLLTQQQQSINAECIGKIMPILFEKPGKHSGQIVGKSPYMQSVHVNADRSLIGKIVPVMIKESKRFSLLGSIAS